MNINNRLMNNMNFVNKNIFISINIGTHIINQCNIFISDILVVIYRILFIYKTGLFI